MWGAIAKFALPFAMNAIGDTFAFRRGKKGAQEQNAENVRQAQAQMNFQREMAGSAEAFSERMSNTAYQRKVADLQAAGLNPALAYEGGASAPQGVTAGGAQARVENTVASGMAAQQLRQNMQATAQAIENATRSTDADVKQKAAAVRLTEQQIKEIQQRVNFESINQPHSTRLLELQKIMSEMGVAGAANKEQLEKWLKEIGGTAGSGAMGKILQLLIGITK